MACVSKPWSGLGQGCQVGCETATCWWRTALSGPAAWVLTARLISVPATDEIFILKAGQARLERLPCNST